MHQRRWFCLGATSNLEVGKHWLDLLELERSGRRGMLAQLEGTWEGLLSRRNVLTRVLELRDIAWLLLLGQEALLLN